MNKRAFDPPLEGAGLPAYSFVRSEILETPMKIVAAHEAETQLSELLDLVESGEEVTIMRHGKPVATLTAAEKAKGNPPNKEAIERAIETLGGIRERIALDGPLNIRELIEDGRRY